MQQTAQHNKNCLGFNCVFIFLLIKFSYYRSWVSSMILWSETSWINGMYGGITIISSSNFLCLFFSLKDSQVGRPIHEQHAVWDRSSLRSKSWRREIKQEYLSHDQFLILDPWSLILDLYPSPHSRRNWFFFHGDIPQRCTHFVPCFVQPISARRLFSCSQSDVSLQHWYFTRLRGLAELLQDDM